MNHFSSTKTTKSKTSSNKKLWAVLAVFGFLLLLFWLFPVVPAQIADAAFAPLFKGESYLRAVVNDNEQEISADQASELEYLRAENAELRSLLSDNSTPGIVAGVVARPASLPFDVLVIDRGKVDGVVEGAPVYASAGQAIGVVASVYRQSSLVALVSTPGWQSTVYLYGPNIYTTINGQGGGVARVHVPQGIEISVGDVAAVPALGGGVFGTVSVVDSVPSRPEQYGYVTMEIPINSLRYVTVGRRSLSDMNFEEAKQVVESTKRDFLKVPVPEGVLVDVEQNASTTATSSSDGTATSTNEAEL